MSGVNPSVTVCRMLPPFVMALTVVQYVTPGVRGTTTWASPDVATPVEKKINDSEDSCGVKYMW